MISSAERIIRFRYSVSAICLTISQGSAEEYARILGREAGKHGT